MACKTCEKRDRKKSVVEHMTGHIFQYLGFVLTMAGLFISATDISDIVVVMSIVISSIGMFLVFLGIGYEHRSEAAVHGVRG